MDGGHNSGGMKSCTSLHRNSTVERARWVGALSFYKQLSSTVVLLLPWKPCRWHSIHIKLFKRNQSEIKCRSIL